MLAAFFVLGLLIAVMAGLTVYLARAQKANEMGVGGPPPPGRDRRALAAAGSDDDDDDSEDDDDQPNRRRRGGGGVDRMRAAARLRQRRQQQQQVAAAPPGPPPPAAEDDDDSSSDEDDNARQQQRQHQPRHERGPSQYDARRRQRDEAREALERAQEEEIARAAEERRRREEAEAAKWAGSIKVEEAGEQGAAGGGDADPQNETLVNDRFVAYVKRRKTVRLEEAAQFLGGKSADALARLEALRQDRRLTGVLDERGKFIYVSEEEMKKVADLIRRSGRIGIAELAAKASELIDLRPAEDEGEEDEEEVAVAAAKGGAKGVDFDALVGEE